MRQFDLICTEKALAFASNSPSVALKNGEKLRYEANIDELIDDNIDVIREGLRSMDPSELRNIEHPLTANIYLHLHTGILRNLAQMKRAGRCNLSYSSKVFTIDGIFGWDSLAFNYQYLLKVLFFSRTGSIRGGLDQLKINVVLDINLETYQIILRQLDFINAGKITIRLEGHLTDIIYNLVLKAVTWIGKGLVLKKIEEETTELIRLDIAEINKLLAEHHVRPFTFVNNAALNRRSTDFLYDFDRFLLSTIRIHF
ncbi:hypothetical protein QAD02_024446 [Eretmocerus hayati]|uniref:Uncharacterized protein n=1 Tax=Eretmocerus hayati TaxID=131215 RepID=A0ACC2Q0D1_9HYME|nr:hypothetical protein QAD02_024446 [Eretmocerus hayati]